MQGWDNVPTAIIVVFGALDAVGKGIDRVTRRGKRERMKQRISRLANKVTPQIPGSDFFVEMNFQMRQKNN